MTRRRHILPGFSLIEVLVALAMLTAALAALGQLVSVSRAHLDGAVEQAVAARLAGNMLARLAAGIDPVEEQQATPLLEDPEWEGRIELLPVAPTGLIEVRAAVRRTNPLSVQSSADEQRWFTFARWMRWTPDAMSDRDSADDSDQSTGAETATGELIQ
jgi:prepilin-type N-terminal cleavage/methylation domain-containing protein